MTELDNMLIENGYKQGIEQEQVIKKNLFFAKYFILKIK